MTMVTPDILIDIRYNFEDTSKTTIYTNARTDNDALEDILQTWIQYQIGKGEDPAHLVEREEYQVKIGLVIEDDSFATEADTGNKGLTTGIVMAVLGMVLDKAIPIKTLSERPLA
jgi:hypothetical protein